MKNSKEQFLFIDEAKQLERRMQSKIDAEEARNFSEAQEIIMFDEKFGIDQERDVGDIKRMMRSVRKDNITKRLGNEFDYENDKKFGRLKYTDEQIEAGQWQEDDLRLVIEELRKERMDNYFGGVAR